MNAMKDEQLKAMRNDPTSAIFDYQVSERFKHVNNEMFMNGSQDSDSHSPLMVYIRSRSAARQDSARVQGVQQAVLGQSKAMEGLWRLDLE